MGIKTFASGGVLYAADVNTYLMNQSVMTFASSSARDTAIPSPTEGMVCYLTDVNQYLMNLSGTTGSWYPIAGQMPYLELTKNATQSITASLETKITWPTVFNRGGFTIANDIVTVPLAGVYRINASLYYPANTAGYRLTRIYINGTLTGNDMLAPSAGGDATVRSSLTINLAANSTIEIRTLQNAATLAIQTGGTRLTVEYVGP